MKRKIVLLAAIIALLAASFAPAQASSVSCSQYHVVQRGEWLSRIARTYGTTWQYLASINGITNPNRIYAGQYLCVVAYTPPPQSTYVVQRGDWLSRIANRFGVSLWSLIQANNIYNPNLIYPGQVLVIPV